MNPLLIILFNFITGTACLMYGVNLMSTGLEKANLKAIKRLLSVWTDKTYKSFIAGTAITALVQSSTAVTVITVGLVDSGLMKLSQAVGIIFGANLGTTITAQLMSFNIGYLSIPVFLLGIAMRLFTRKPFLKSLSLSFIGFGFMFLGITVLNLGVPYIRESEYVFKLFSQYGQNPFIGLLIGMVTTMLVHSSSATVGLTIVLFNSGLIGFESAIGLTLGDNIGTCITAQLASLGTSISARRTAWAHTLYNVIGVIIAVAVFIPFTELVKLITAVLGQDNSRLIANTHTVFNILSAMIFLPVTKYYVKFIESLIKD
ncbi:MAG: Na/Pi symporter [Clostridia bacterium]|nr:Na/Pi symporter [Clostridia bacterium]